MNGRQSEMTILHQALDYVLGRSPRVQKLEAAVQQMDASTKELRVSVNKLGQDVWSMVQTGDPLRALVNGARNAQFDKAAADEDRRDHP